MEEIIREEPVREETAAEEPVRETAPAFTFVCDFAGEKADRDSAAGILSCLGKKRWLPAVFASAATAAIAFYGFIGSGFGDSRYCVYAAIAAFYVFAFLLFRPLLLKAVLKKSATGPVTVSLTDTELCAADKSGEGRVVWSACSGVRESDDAFAFVTVNNHMQLLPKRGLAADGTESVRAFLAEKTGKPVKRLPVRRCRAWSVVLSVCLLLLLAAAGVWCNASEALAMRTEKKFTAAHGGYSVTLTEAFAEYPAWTDDEPGEEYLLDLWSRDCTFCAYEEDMKELELSGARAYLAAFCTGFGISPEDGIGQLKNGAFAVTYTDANNEGEYYGMIAALASGDSVSVSWAECSLETRALYETLFTDWLSSVRYTVMEAL